MPGSPSWPSLCSREQCTTKGVAITRSCSNHRPHPSSHVLSAESCPNRILLNFWFECTVSRPARLLQISTYKILVQIHNSLHSSLWSPAAELTYCPYCCLRIGVGYPGTSAQTTHTTRWQPSESRDITDNDPFEETKPFCTNTKSTTTGHDSTALQLEAFNGSARRQPGGPGPRPAGPLRPLAT
eukprot:2672517-Rhodomonas_salina.1